VNIRELILSTATTSAAKPVPVDTGEWGTLHLRVMTGAERDAYEARVYRDRDEESGAWIRPDNLRAHLLVRTVCDADGKRVFEDDDVDALGEADSRLIDALHRKSLDLNRLGAHAVDEEKKG
jgi:hypothetical protein